MKQLDGINLILGVWLIFSPFVLAYSTFSAVLWNDVAVGALLGAASLWNLTMATAGQTGISALEAACGVWLVVAPFALHDPLWSHAMSNDIAVGLIVLIVGSTQTWALTHRHA